MRERVGTVKFRVGQVVKESPHPVSRHYRKGVVTTLPDSRGFLKIRWHGYARPVQVHQDDFSRLAPRLERNTSAMVTPGSGGVSPQAFDIDHLNPRRRRRNASDAVEHLADEIILPRLWDYGPETWFSAAQIHAMADRGLREEGAPLVSQSMVRRALTHLIQGGEVLHIEGKGFTPLRRAPGHNPLKPGELLKPYNVRAIVSNVDLVFRRGTITKLNGSAYGFIIMHMGFIAHFNLSGFRYSYDDLRLFAEKLQTSEHSHDFNYNLRFANEMERRGTDPQQLRPPYSKEYYDSVGRGIRGVVTVAKKHFPRMFTKPGVEAQIYNPRSRTAEYRPPSLPKRKFGDKVYTFYEWAFNQTDADRLRDKAKAEGNLVRVEKRLSDRRYMTWIIWVRKR